MTKPVWSHILALSAWKPEPRLQKPACKANSSPTELSNMSQSWNIEFTLSTFNAL